MDSREQPPHHPNVMVGPTSFPNTIPPSIMAPATARFPFTSMPHHHHHQPPPPPSNNNNSSSEPFTINNNNNNNSVAPYEDGSSSALKPCGLTAIDSGKKKRGRPRKYSPDAANIALGLAPAVTQQVSPPPSGGSSAPSSEPLAKKHRGRPPGSGKKQLDALGAGGTGFTPHVIFVETGEDIAAKVVAFSQEGPRTVCILSAHGAISNITLRQPTTPGGTVTYEGLFEIISLSGSTLLSEKGSGHSKMDGLSVSLAGSDGRVLGGIVAGTLMAASQVQVIVGSFIAERKKSSSNNLKSGPSAPSPQMLTFGAPASPTSPTSQGPSSDSSDDNDTGPGLYNNAPPPIHNMPLYHHPLWAGQTQQ
ncbi:hypothetical protein TanjilG_27826 [Lupinus angustifolius]|uniref:AT-hook motif nuclear-localized protein n=1 Tax=Lupinus angustifolius TaxID=3871 RepID=A0A4P1RHE1_LUPAN|nr:PREDICTED: AT-hook motif nuclear-localized protein 13-like [Lupinus angustifolius]OIW10880.1 hypothetical protein TanjilG_27826 [Lupinus angustifolius]